MEAKSNNLLDEALARGVITNEQRMQLASLQQTEAPGSDEPIKPVGSFNEVFVTVGVMMLLSAASGVVHLMLGGAILTGLVSIAMTVAMAEYFHRHKRFRLPIIYGILSAGMALMTLMRVVVVGKDTGFFDISHGVMMAVWPMLAGLAVFIAGAARYRTPFIMLPIAILFTVMVTFAADHASSDTPFKLLLGACGLSILSVAIYFDMKDPQRISRFSDFAFWAYMVGSPLFVHSLFLSVLIDADTVIGSGTWFLIAFMASCVSFAGVLLNRRALILSTMLYVGYVLVMVLKNTPMGISSVVLITVMLIGVYIIALGSRWVQVRRAFMSRLPAWPWLNHLPPYA